MRYVIRLANAVDLACITAVARTILDDQGERLLKVYALSSQVWLAATPDGGPDALFGVAPLEDDPATGEFWMFLFNAFTANESDRRNVLRLVLDEMFKDFVRLENRVDRRKTWLLDLMASVGFTIEAPTTRESGLSCHYVWLESRENGTTTLAS